MVDVLVKPPETPAQSQVALKSSGQRRVNMMWETTQSLVAITVTGATLYVSSKLALIETKHEEAFLLLSNSFFLVIGFYFGRTNHQRTGGPDVTNEAR